MSDKCIWITVENSTPEEIDQIGRELEGTNITDRYEIIVTDDEISTLDKEELLEALE